LSLENLRKPVRVTARTVNLAIVEKCYVGRAGKWMPERELIGRKSKKLSNWQGKPTVSFTKGQ
jgi:hypothetical protein